MKHPLLLLLSLLITAPAVFSQASQAAHPSAALEVRSENQGFLLPRMNTFQRSQIQAPAIGLTIYNTSLQSLEIHTGGGDWVKLGAASSTIDLLFDTDMDTGVYVQKADDEDIIRLETAGTERLTVTEDGNVGIGTATPGASALLEISSTTKAFLPPRMTTAQRDAIATKVAGMVVYNTTTNALETYDGTEWSSGSSDSILDKDGDTGIEVEKNTDEDIIRLETAGTERLTVAKDGNVGIGTATPGASALLEISSTTKAFLPPRMTTAQRDAIATKVAGMVVYNTTTNALETYDGTEWSSGSSDSILDKDGDTGIEVEKNTDEDIIRLETAGTERLTVAKDGNVGIGTATPGASALLEISSTTKAFLPPRMTTAQRDAIATKVAGMVVYNTTTNALETYDGTEWSSGSSDSILDKDGDTGIEVEKNTDEDIIRLETAGTERLTVAKDGNVGIGTATPGASALLEISSTTKAFLPPRMTTAQRDAIATKVAGMVVYNTTTNALETYDGTEWSSGSSDSILDKDGDTGIEVEKNTDEDIIRLETAGTERLTVAKDGNVGIGTATPGASALLEISSTTKAFLPPRMTTAQRDAIATKVAGMVVYNTTTNALETYDGSEWSSGSSDSILDKDGDTGIEVEKNTDEDIIRLETAGTERLTVAKDGNVGIGTATPGASALLEISSTTKAFLPPRMTTAQRDAIATKVAGMVVYNTTTNALETYDGTEWSSGSSDSILDKDGDTGIEVEKNTDEDIIRLETAGTERLTVAKDGNVGIGVTAPSARLDVSGTSEFNGIINTKGNWISGDGGSEGISVNSSGNVGIGTTGPSAKLDVNGTSEFNGIINTKSNWISGDGGSEGIKINGSGNVGIGNSSPNDRLDVSGDAHISGKFKDSAGDTGTDGQILSSKADGTTDWVDATATSASGITVVNETTFDTTRGGGGAEDGVSFLNTADNKLYIAGGGKWRIFTGTEGGQAPPLPDFTYQAPQDTQRTYGHITSAATGKIWLDRNLGATRRGTAPADSQAFGKYYIHPDAMTACPTGYHLPTRTEIEAEGFTNGSDAWNKLKIVYGGSMNNNGSTTVYNSTDTTYMWSSTSLTNPTTYASYLYMSPSTADIYSAQKTGNRMTVRCIKSQ